MRTTMKPGPRCPKRSIEPKTRRSFSRADFSSVAVVAAVAVVAVVADEA